MSEFKVTLARIDAVRKASKANRFALCFISSAM
jgi:hypothetical protein